MNATPATPPHVLSAAGTSLVIEVPSEGLPRVLHWGARVTTVSSAPESPATVGAVLLPGQVDGWMGRPGVSGHRDGAHPHLRWTVTRIAFDTADGEGGELSLRATDETAGVELRSLLRMEPSGLLRLRHSITNIGDGTWTVESLCALLPIPAEAAELLDTTGHWAKERSPQRVRFGHSTVVKENRRGRTGFDAPPFFVAGTPGFGFRRGEVWGVHVGWSGNHQHWAQRLPEGEGVLAGGELPAPGEIRLAAGQTYQSPWVHFAYSPNGLDGLSAASHDWLRSRPEHPGSDRPLTLNVWEAVYFDHDFTRLTALADTAAAIGVERFVLDDGWFLGRRDDTAGLGDWYVDADVWPEGLHPLAAHVRELGMEFGLWVEPEMINPRSRLATAHPDWYLAAPGRLPTDIRHQQVLDLARPEVFEYLLDRLDSLVTEYRLTYLKWDHNRDLVEAVHGDHAGVHGQTLAVYRLIDELKDRHPGLEIESCSSGGGRVDLGILARTERIWTSDNTDAVERQHIQRWTGLLVPPELCGAHVSAPLNHQTGRVSSLRLRLTTALFGHAGIEWDVTGCDPDELAQLTAWARAYKRLRPMIHSGVTVTADHPDPSAHLYGIVSADRSHALFAYAQLTSSAALGPVRLRLPGLDPTAVYTATTLPELNPPDWKRQPWQPKLTMTGDAFAGHGIAGPILRPADGYVIELHRH